MTTEDIANPIPDVVAHPILAPDDLIRLLREQLLAFSRAILTRREGYQVNYKKITDYIAALQAVDELEKMPAIVDASLPF